MKEVIAYLDENGKLHSKKEDALYSDAQSKFFSAVSSTTYQGEFAADDFLEMLKKDDQLKQALKYLCDM